jgi:selenocysteine lyase/cysteine desulfurase
LNANWRPTIDQARGAAARLLNCDKSEIAFVRSTAEGLSIVARGVDWRNGDRIVTTNVEYPTNMYPWMDVARRFGVDLIAVEETTDAKGARVTPLARILEAAAKPGVKAVAISHVEFGSGQRHDLAAIGSFCREREILLIGDAIQSFGAVPIDVKGMKIDYLSAGGQKWLLSPEGTGIFYCRKELLEKTPPLTVGAMSVVNFMDFEHFNYNLKPDAGRFESGGMNVAGLMGMGASLEMFTKIGMAAVSVHIKILGDRLIAGLMKKGYSIACPREGEQWSGIVSFASAKHSHDEIAAKLKKEHRIELVVRHGRLRASPHFYNTEEQIDRLVECLPGN